MSASRTWAPALVDADGRTIVPDVDPGEAGAQVPEEPPAPAGSVARVPGERLGRFELVRRLGEGTTGEVWEAVDRRYDAPVALKLFAEQPGRGTATMERVMAEARAASRVVSDHLVYVRDAGRIEPAGPYYLAMGLCREEIAEDAAPVVARSLVEDGPRSLAEAVRWGEQIARGVAAAHAQRVFHRDLKPENVLCLPRSRAVRILDFGLAPLADTDRASVRGVPTQTLFVRDGGRASLIAGTPAYMAPEQARGFTRAPDPERDAERLAALDVYGVGATLWALLAGRPPHCGAKEAIDPLQVIERAATRPAPRLRSVRTRFPVPRRLERIVAKAMAANPADRYPSAAALAVDLARFAASRPTSLDERWSPVRPLLFLRRHPAAAVGAVWAVLFVVGVGVIARVSAEVRDAYAELDEARGEVAATRAEAVAASDRAREEEARADEAADAVSVQTARAETAEEHVAHLRQYAVELSERGDTEELRADQAEAMADLQAQRADEAEAAARKETERAEHAEAQAAAEGARAATAESERSAAVQRAEAAEQAAAEALRKAAQASEDAAEARARADRAEEQARAAEAALAKATTPDPVATEDVRDGGP